MVLLEFSMSPLGKGESVGRYVARSLEIVDASGVDYRLNPMGTVLEGEWDEVFGVVRQCYERLRRDCSWRSGMAYSRVCGAATAFRPVAVGVGGAERGAPMSQGAYSRVCRGCNAERRCSAGLLCDRTHSESNGFPVARQGNSASGPAPLIFFIHPHDPWADSSQDLITNCLQLGGKIIGGDRQRSLLPDQHRLIPRRD